MKRGQLISAFLLLVVLAVYGQVASFEFINYDDPEYIINNEHVTGGLSGANIKWAFTTGSQANWHPVTWVSLMADATFFGSGPRGFHLVNVAFHALNTLLVFILLSRLTGAFWRSALVAALFAVHPMHVESVAWITERKDVLSLFWGLLSLLAYERYARGGGRGSYLLTAVFLAVGLMAKSLLVTLPFVFLLLDYWPLGRWSPGANAKAPSPGKLILEKIPFLALVILSSVATYVAQAGSGAVAADMVLGPAARVANALVSYVRYLGKLVWPKDMAYLYPHPDLPGGTPLAAWQVGGSVMLLLGLSFLVFRLRRHRFLTVGWLWFLGTMVPMIGLIQVGTQAMADRYTYLPYLGIYMMLVWGIGLLVKTGPVARSASKPPLERSVAVGLAVVTLVALLVVAYGQIGVWRDSVTLGKHAIAKGAVGPKVNYNLATALSRSGHFAEAVPYYEATIRLKPDHAKAYNNLGRTLGRLKKYDQALRSFDRAIALEPDVALAYENKSNTLADIQRLPEAIAVRQKAVQLDPNNMDSHLALGGMLAAVGRLDEAIAEFELVLSRVPNHQEAAQFLAQARRFQAQRNQETSP